MNVKEKVDAKFEELVALRRHFHENPEKSGEEFETLAYIKDFADKKGWETIEVKDGGLLAIIDSGKPGKNLLLRADVDALPIEESPNNLKGPKACCSKKEGFSHACGHDCHTAMTMMAGTVLSENKDAWSGKIILCFERGEEYAANIKVLLPYLVKDFKLKIDGAYGTHVRWDIPVGKVSIKEGPVMAGGLGFSIKLKGVFGHGARPDLANNPLDCFVAIYQDLQACRMRSVSPYETLTFSIGQLHGGDQVNVIPGELVFGGTSRFFSLEKAGQHFLDTLLSSLEHECKIYNCSYEKLRLLEPIYEVRNNTDCAKMGQKAIVEALGEDALYDEDPWMASESMGLYLQEFPGVLSFTGIANPDLGSGANHHTPEFDVDENGLKAGAAMAVSYALNFLKPDFTPEFTPNPEDVYKLADRNI